MTPSLCRAARALLSMNQAELARAADLGLSTVVDFEREQRQVLWRRSIQCVRSLNAPASNLLMRRRRSWCSIFANRDAPDESDSAAVAFETFPLGGKDAFHRNRSAQPKPRRDGPTQVRPIQTKCCRVQRLHASWSNSDFLQAIVATLRNKANFPLPPRGRLAPEPKNR